MLHRSVNSKVVSIFHYQAGWSLPIAWMIVCSLLLLSNATWAQTPESGSQEAQIKLDLEKIRSEMRATQDAQLKTQNERGQLLTALRAQELKVAELIKSLRLIEASLAVQRHELTGLTKQEENLRDKLMRQRDALAALLRSAYAIGRHEKLQVLFAREKVADTQRLLAYHRYLERDRNARIGAIRDDQIALEKITTVMRHTEAKLQTEVADKKRQSLALTEERAAREQTLTALDAQLATQSERLRLMQDSERELVQLLARLQNAIADVPVQIAGDVPFASRQGRLPWPARGPVKAGFGARLSDGRQAEGWLIAAAPGSSVHAIARGRVAYADWLNGYGLLVILDHGEGFMSLYARGESILVDVGTWVEAGEPLATASALGSLTQSAAGGLYFELRRNGQPLNPKLWFSR